MFLPVQSTVAVSPLWPPALSVKQVCELTSVHYREMASLVMSTRKVRVLQTELPEAFLLSIRPELTKGY